ncbi:MAG: hypothetical protein JXA46_07505 [Dehalococcoidales bacterium]|nr:hypothetical protein [Dehalococcoidales bacterium]
MVEEREPIASMNEELNRETQEPNSELEEQKIEQPVSEEEADLQLETTTTPEEETTRVDIVTGDKRMTMSAPVPEFEELKTSFKAMMLAFGNFIEATGLEIGKDENGEKISALSEEIERLRGELTTERDQVMYLVATKDELEAYKAENEEKMAQQSEDYIRREEFDRFRQAIRDAF